MIFSMYIKREEVIRLNGNWKGRKYTEDGIEVALICYELINILITAEI